MRTLIFQHSHEEKPGSVTDWLQISGHSYTLFHTYQNSTLPKPENFDALVILGGPMNVDEETKYPWLREEKTFLENWLKLEKFTLGICLGGQMLAQVLGGRVEKNKEREIGFHEVKRTGQTHPALNKWPERTQVFQWHEDRFTLPSTCQPLLTSAACEFQGLALNNKTVGLQFHPESTEQWILGNYLSFSPGKKEPFVQPKEECQKLLPTLLPEMRKNFFAFLDEFSKAP